MEKQITSISCIALEWNDWVWWNELKVDARKDGIKVPNKAPGVYEVKYRETEERLTDLPPLIVPLSKLGSRER